MDKKKRKVIHLPVVNEEVKTVNRATDTLKTHMYTITSNTLTFTSTLKSLHTMIMDDLVSPKFDNTYIRVILLQTQKKFVINVLLPDAIKSGLFEIMVSAIRKDIQETKNLVYSVKSVADSLNTTPENIEFQLQVEQYVPLHQIDTILIDQMKEQVHTITNRRVFIAYKLFVMGYMLHSDSIVEQATHRPYLDIIGNSR